MLGPLLPVLYKVLAIYIGLGLVLAFSERSMVYLPHLGDPPDFGACAALSNAVAKEYEGVRLYHERVSDTRVAVLYHGNAGSVCDRAAFARSFAAAGYSYVLVEYPGYANDPDGTPAKRHILADTKRVHAFLAEEEYAEITLVGESLGGGPASYHAARHPPEQLILISPYYELSDGAGLLGWLYPLNLLMRENYTPGRWLTDTNVPTLLIRAEHDEIFPRASVMRLTRVLKGETQLIEIEDTTHNALYTHPELYATIQQFLRREEGLIKQKPDLAD